MSDEIVEYAGLTKRAAMLIEEHRMSPGESKSDIVIRVLSAKAESPTGYAGPTFDLGQGARLRVGESVYLFLSEEAKRARKADATAVAKDENSFYLGDKKIAPSKGSVIQPAMQIVQRAKKHVNGKGELVSLSAWRQWHVERDGKLLPVLELKDPSLAHKRGRNISGLPTEIWDQKDRLPQTPEDLGL
jgi:hypothetical protein